MRGGALGRTITLAALALVALAAAWGGGAEPVLRPLLDEAHAPDLLVEERRLVRPPASHGNRFLTGWSPEIADGALRLVPAAAGARLELVQLAARPRRLAVDLATPPAGGFLRLRHGARDLGRFPLADPLEVPLPADLPLGRVALDLAWEMPDGAAPPRVAGAAVRPALATGGMRVDGTDLLQRGDSLIDLVRPVAGGETLAGAFRPPWPPRSGQRFELILERESGEVARLAWTPSWLDLFRPARAIRLPLGPEPGFVRVRLRAEGGGPSCRWRDLRLESAAPPASEPPSEAPSVAAVDPPRLAPPRLVIVYVLDALRADRVGHLGGPPELSPTLDRLAFAGRSYRLHRSVAPNTLPSTKALFTGRTALAGGDLPLAPEDGPTLAERFRAAGYRTGLFSGNVFVSRAFGMDRGFEHVAEEALVESGGRRAVRFNDNAARVHAAALAWLRARPSAAPAFLYLHAIHPHNPYDPPPPFRARFAGGGRSPIGGSTETLLAVRAGERALAPPDVRRLRGLYAGGLAYGDAELAAFLRAVGKRVPAEETLLAVTSDHGEELLEHGGILHGYTLYEEMLRIPAVLWGPGRVAPEAVFAPTSTLDLRRALLATAGLAPAPEEDTAPAADPAAPAVHFAAAASVPGGIFSAQTARWKVVWAPRRGVMWGVGEGIGRSRDAEYVFDLARDPRETVNLAGAPGLDLEAVWLRQCLLGWVESEGGAAPPDPALDAQTRERLRALGYLR